MNAIEEAIIRQRFLPIVDFASVKNPDKFFEVLMGHKIEVLQVNFRSKGQMDFLPAIGEWNARYAPIQVGVGFVYSPADAEKAVQNGAQFLVSSVMAKDILSMAELYRVPAIVSGLTPTEIYQAKGTGAGLVQVFPASQIPLRSIVSILEHLPDMKLMLTGGITLYEALEILRLGVSAVGIKGSIFQKEHLEGENYAAISDSIRNFRSRIQSI